ncbi:UDP-N-acetylmuramyl pentapeptide phosphotransferase/UDP-N-acetylglucosamine-1-phosphate transferase [Sporobacter termitidis DSM 10068]|uniref:UDP-N-acetylmuramyl pentapeptide phosphotransferase/UDP-N-acetylglucosamine-1-phosphate transferase n=1 Tax=Sporobacter termitidis DSM 10068 TaxID=1123282 RepID=A0A1M5Z298_9FIRM|nr:MraY family glycosyltransferase [Sporobacter termitidis]SHI18003.1 UDP-N-acetylmuramyl pentapeptide phosphotransferase/UDP-N-acetylglucosamine-1-phosphate transferase [Sporobacter termitidis DSM 10068]
MLQYIIALVLSLALMLLLTPRLRKLAIRLDYQEKPKADEERKIHTEAKPYLAGLGIFLTFWVCYFLILRDFSMKSWLLLLGSTMIFGVGMLDDWFKIKGRDLKALPKFLVQLAASVLIYYAGVRFFGFTNVFNGSYILLPAWLQFTLTITWLVGVTTVINFMDGMDGLAGGLSCISAGTLFVVALAKGSTYSAVMGIVLVGICLGYLKYNKFPAKILMGDAGATFLGFMLAIISLDGAFKQATLISIFVPVLALGLPIFDNIFVVLKRMKNRKPIYVGDTSQIHYRLLSKGMTQKQVVMFLYLISLSLNLLAIIIFMAQSYTPGLA